MDEAKSRIEKDFIIKLSRWENSLDKTLIGDAAKAILRSRGGKPPRVLDPFAGGGSIPLEALRLGCETYAGDYNPVATLILKCTIEYPQKYGGRDGHRDALRSDETANPLLEDVKRWGSWVLEEARKDIGKFYPEEDGSLPVGFVWARTVHCQNPSCRAEIPLMRQFWLANTRNKKVALYPDAVGNELRFKIVGTGYEKMPRSFNPESGTISRAVARCLVCGSIIADDTIRSLFMGGKSGQRMMVVVLHKEENGGKKYRVANEEDMQLFRNAEHYLEEKRKSLLNRWGLDPVPDEQLPPTGTLGFRIQRYNMKAWGDLFNVRQKLALVVLAEKIRNAHMKMLEEKYDSQYATALTTYLAFDLDRLADYSSQLCVWAVSGEFVAHTFGRQALPMVWDYFEVSPFSRSSGDWASSMGWIGRVIDHCSSMISPPAQVRQGTATSLPYPNDFFDAVFTDPPYYDNVPYSHLSDFFYVWLKRTVGHLYPELFATPLTPKRDEIVAYYDTERTFEEGKIFFEETLKKSFFEIERVLKQNGISIIVFSHKSTAGWETLLNSLLESGLVVTAAWPLHTERPGRLRAIESAALASSIYMVARKLTKQNIGFYKEIKEELKRHLDRVLDRLWKEGISGADFFISAIGSSIEVFGKYQKIVDDEGNIIRANKLLEDIRRIVTDYAVRQVLHNGFVEEITPLTRFYVLWRWAYGDATLQFDDAHKLGQGVGIDLPHEWNKGFIRKNKELIEILGPEDRDLSELEDSAELIDALHHALLLWKKGQSEQISKLLNASGFGKSDVFYRVAQAISESSVGSKEKKLLEGFLQGRQRISEDLRKQSEQTKLIR